MSSIARIILVDDNDSDNLYHSIIIKRAGFTGELLVFETGPDALAFLRAADLKVPTLVFLDINMPRMDGFEMATEAEPLIRDSATIIIVMLTSSGSPHDKERAEQMPVIRGFMTKPLTVESTQALLAAPPAK